MLGWGVGALVSPAVGGGEDGDVSVCVRMLVCVRLVLLVNGVTVK